MLKWIVLVVLLLPGCAVTATPSPTRGVIVGNLAPLEEMEALGINLRQAITEAIVNGYVPTREQQLAIKESYAIYYIYTVGANVALSEGDMERYEDQIDKGNAELETIRLIMIGDPL